LNITLRISSKLYKYARNILIMTMAIELW
jgi:hypothetical protein